MGSAATSDKTSHWIQRRLHDAVVTAKTLITMPRIHYIAMFTLPGTCLHMHLRHPVLHTRSWSIPLGCTVPQSVMSMYLVMLFIHSCLPMPLLGPLGVQAMWSARPLHLSYCMSTVTA